MKAINKQFLIVNKIILIEKSFGYMPGLHASGNHNNALFNSNANVHVRKGETWKSLRECQTEEKTVFSSRRMQASWKQTAKNNASSAR